MDQSLKQLATQALRINPKERDRKPDAHKFGIVKSINEDGSYQVLLDDAPDTPIRCITLCNANAKDRVVVLVTSSDDHVVIGRKGGDALRNNGQGDYLAGEGIRIKDLVISAEVTEDDLMVVRRAIPTNVSELVNDSEYVSSDALEERGYLTDFTETDPTVPSWAKQTTKPTYTADEVGAEPSGAVSAHNVATDAHNDIRLLVEGLTTRLNALADSDDTTLDQLSEIVAYIKANKALIESVTTDKVSVSAIVDNLTTNVSDMPLSAAQGVVLKALIDAIEIPTNVSAFTNDAGYLTALPSHSHDVITYQNTRDTNQTPDQLSAGLSIHLKCNATDGMSDGGNYHPVLAMKPWTDISGGPYGQLAMTQNGNMYWRVSTSGTAWGDWQQVAKRSEIPSLDGYATDAEVDAAIDGIHIGGRNLIAGTDDTTVFSGAAAAEGSTKDVWSGVTIATPTGTEYVVSFDAKADSDMTISCYFYSPNTTLTSESSTGQKRDSVVDGSSQVSVTTEWKRYWVKWTQTAASTVKKMIVGRNSSTDMLYIRAVKLEEGNMPSTWSPAPEDMAMLSDIPSITYGTADLTAGTSALATGAMYLVYE